MSEPKEAYQQVMLILARSFPHLYFLSKYLRVVYVDKFSPQMPVATDGRTIWITKSWLIEDIHFKLASFIHELYHVLLKHPLRMAQVMNATGADWLTVVTAFDAKVNYLELRALEKRDADLELYAKLLPTYGIPKDMLETASAEEIVKWLMQNLQTPAPTFGLDVRQGGGDGSGASGGGQDQEEQQEGEGGGGGEGKDQQNQGGQGGGSDQDRRKGGEGDKQDRNQEGQGSSRQSSGQSSGMYQTLNEGKPELVNAQTLDELEKKLSEAIRSSLLSAKIAGAHLTSIEERILNELVKAKVNWRAMFRNAVLSYIRKCVVSSYRRPNRKIPYLPGFESIAKPKAWVFVDVSGSISEEEFEQFLSEVYHLSRNVSEVRLITWDTVVTGEYDIRNREELKKIRFKGGGGTTFAPVLRNYMKQIRNDDVFICLTDGYWFDMKEAENLLNRIKAFKVLVTTGKIPGNFDKVVKIEV